MKAVGTTYNGYTIQRKRDGMGGIVYEVDFRTLFGKEWFPSLKKAKSVIDKHIADLKSGNSL